MSRSSRAARRLRRSSQAVPFEADHCDGVDVQVEGDLFGDDREELDGIGFEPDCILDALLGRSLVLVAA